MKKRDYSVDLIKIIAMFSVIGLHVFGASEDWRRANFFYETFVIAIPLFFMSSGYCLFGRADITIKYAIKKIVNIVKFVFIMSLAVLGIGSLTIGVFDFDIFIETFEGAFFQKGVLWICWYLGAMAILYMLLPSLNYLYMQKRKIFNSIIICLFVVEFLMFAENLNNDGKCIEMRVIQTFRIWNWLFYFMLGGGNRNMQNTMGKYCEICRADSHAFSQYNFSRKA